MKFWWGECCNLLRGIIVIGKEPFFHLKPQEPISAFRRQIGKWRQLKRKQNRELQRNKVLMTSLKHLDSAVPQVFSVIWGNKCPDSGGSNGVLCHLQPKKTWQMPPKGSHSTSYQSLPISWCSSETEIQNQETEQGWQITSKSHANSDFSGCPEHCV